MIVNHATGQPISERALLRLFHTQVAAGNPRIGTEIGVRGPWSSPPTDEQLRSVKPKHSLLVEIEQPTPGEGEQVRPDVLEFDTEADVWRRPWIVEPVPVFVPEKVEGFKVKQRLSEIDLLTTVEAMVSQASPLVQLAWSAPFFHRTSALIAKFAVALGISDLELDAIFIAAHNIET